MRLAIVAGLWRRHELADAWWQGVTRIADQWATLGYTVDIVVSGSESQHLGRALLADAVWVRVPNRPLGAKLNAAARVACQRGADALFLIGSDNWFSPGAIATAARYASQGHRYIGMEGCWFTEYGTGRAARFPGYPADHPRHGEPIGPGRYLDRRLVPADGCPWEPERERGMDDSMQRRCNLPRPALVMQTRESVLLDVKTRESLGAFDHVTRTLGLSVTADPPELGVVPEWPMLSGARETQRMA